MRPELPCEKENEIEKQKIDSEYAPIIQRMYTDLKLIKSIQILINKMLDRLEI